jgi:hypothetical protein
MMIVREWHDEDKGRLVIWQYGRSGPEQWAMEDALAIFRLEFYAPSTPNQYNLIYRGGDWNEAERIFTEKVMELEARP